MKPEHLPKSHYELAKDFFYNVDTYGLKEFLDHIGIDDPTFDQFCNSITNYDEELKKRVSCEFNIFYHLYNLKHNHEKIYYITPNLAARLAKTVINIDSRFIKSPFREIFVQVDNGLFSIVDIDGTKNPCCGFYIYLREFPDHKELRCMAVSILKPTESIPFNDSNFYFRINLDNNGKIKELIESDFKKRFSNKEELERSQGARNIDSLEEFTYFVINTLLYLTSKNPDIISLLPIDYSKRLQNIKSTHKIRKMQQRASKASTMPVFVLGANMGYDSDIKAIGDSGGIGQWKLNKKVAVSGHWRAQWYGSEDNKHSEIIWISDYDKGPDMAETISKIQVGKSI